MFTRRRCAKYTERRTVFAGGDLADARTLDAERVYLVGKPPGVEGVLAAAGTAKVYLDGHYPVVKYDGQTVTWAGTWFGDTDYTAEDCADVWATLRAVIARLWRGQSVALLATPATTGRDLWVRTVPPDGYPVLERALQAAIAADSGQGRIEVMAGTGLVRMHEYDARLAYLGVTRNMPAGWPVRYSGADAVAWCEANPYKPARVTVTFRVPYGWGRRPGILPLKVEGADVGWAWPTAGGQQYGPTVVEASEMFIARRHGWGVDVHSVIGWEDTADVFGVWQTRLVKAFAEGADHYRQYPTRAAMFRSAVRALVLHAIGAMHGAPHKVTHVGGDPDTDARSIRYLADGRLVWHTIRAPAWPQLSHPEWTATIWGRARGRLLDGPNKTGALNLDAGAVVAFRTDAIYTTGPTGWEDGDDGRPGRYRLKGVTRQVPWPRSGLDVLAAKAPAQ